MVLLGIRHERILVASCGRSFFSLRVLNSGQCYQRVSLVEMYFPVLNISEGFKCAKPTTRMRQFLIEAYKEESNLGVLEMFDYELKNMLGHWQYVKLHSLCIHRMVRASTNDVRLGLRGVTRLGSDLG
jgi:hypothetical protein